MVAGTPIWTLALHARGASYCSRVAAGLRNGFGHTFPTTTTAGASGASLMPSAPAGREQCQMDLKLHSSFVHKRGYATDSGAAELGDLMRSIVQRGGGRRRRGRTQDVVPKEVLRRHMNNDLLCSPYWIRRIPISYLTSSRKVTPDRRPSLLRRTKVVRTSFSRPLFAAVARCTFHCALCCRRTKIDIQHRLTVQIDAFVLVEQAVGVFCSQYAQLDEPGKEEILRSLARSVLRYRRSMVFSPANTMFECVD